MKFFVSFLLALSLSVSEQQNTKGKVLMSMTTAKGICDWQTNTTKALYPQGGNKSAEVADLRNRFQTGPVWASCQGVKWSKCGKGCSKFQFQDCPTPPKRTTWKGINFQSRIVGGLNAVHGEIPYIALLEINVFTRCGGVLVSPHYVLTAAHCFEDAAGPSSVKLLFGSISASKPHPDSQKRTAKKLIPFPNWNSLVDYNDFGIIELDAPVQLNRIIQTSIIATTDIYPSGLALVSGWGKTPNAIPDILKKAVLLIMPLEECELHTPPSIKTDLCTISNGTSTCYGDSGGPLVQEYNANCSWLVGMVRAGIDCGVRHHPSKFVAPQLYDDFIKLNVNAKIPQVNPIPNPPKDKKLEANPKEFPYQVRILSNGITICGGAIVNSLYVLTSASCLFNQRLSAATMTVVAGEISISTVELTEQTRQVQSFNAHRDFDPLTHWNDIGLVKVKQPFTKTASVDFAFLPLRDHQINGPLYTTGWGYLANPSIFPTLQKIKTRRVNFSECYSLYGCLLTDAESMLICGHTDNGGNPCRTDFGGPLAEKIGEGEYMIIGIVSYRIECNEKYPTVYTNVKNYLNWLNSQITSHSSINAKSNSYPFLAVIKVNGIPMCTGSLINPTHVLSAASCFTNLPPTAIRDHVTVVVGKNNLVQNEFKDSTVPVEKIIIHESYNQRTNLHDIALVHLKEDAPLSNHVHPLVLRDSFPVFKEGDTATSIGWGIAQNESLSALQEISLDLLSDFECKTAYGLTLQNIIKEMLCTHSLGKGYCVGDSGGPLILPAASTVPCFGLLGIMSVAPECKPVTANIISVPSIYTEVAYYVPWIRRNLLTTNLHLDSNMVGGANAAQNEFPFLVKVTYGRVTICAGAILSEFFVLTTAFCVNEKRFGLLSITAGTGNAIQRRSVGPYRQHKLFNAVTMENDVCVMQLVHPLVFNNVVSKIPLLNEFEYNGTFRDSQLRQFLGDLIVGGWAQNTPQSMVMGIIPLDSCWKSYGCTVESLVGKILCASRFRPNFDTTTTPCELMRGSPITASLFNGTKILLGLASFGTNCSSISNPSIFTQLEHYYPWIEENDLIKGENNATPHSFPSKLQSTLQGNLFAEEPL